MSDGSNIDGDKLWRVLGRMEQTMVTNHEAIERIGNSLRDHVKGCNEDHLKSVEKLTRVESATEQQGLSLIGLRESIDALNPTIRAHDATTKSVDWFKSNIVNRAVYVLVGAAVIWGLLALNILPAALNNVPD